MYQEIILDHYRNPHHRGLRDPFDVEVHHVNPTCGDEVTLRVHLDGDTATHLCGVYGARAPVLGALIAAERGLAERINADLPYVWAEVEFAIRHDLARTVDDVLSRRAPLLLVGREQELASLAGLVERARHGSAGSVVLRGEPGVGKSTLLDGLVADERTGAMPTLVTDVLMPDAAGRERLARETLDFARSLAA